MIVIGTLTAVGGVSERPEAKEVRATPTNDDPVGNLRLTAVHSSEGQRVRHQGFKGSQQEDVRIQVDAAVV